jgi:hypothetical protein
MNEARQPWGRRAKFREETPVTRQNEEPNFTLRLTMHRTIKKVKKKEWGFRIVFGHLVID